MHIITIEPGFIGRCQQDGVGHLLGPGTHRINHPRFTYLGDAPASKEHIKAKCKHRIIVPEGMMGLASRNGVPEMLEPGEPRYIDDPDFVVHELVSWNADVIRHGPVHIITVAEGRFGIMYDQGRIIVLPPGRHRRNNPLDHFEGFTQSGIQTLGIPRLQLLTADSVGLILDAAMTVQIVDPRKAVIMLANDQTATRAEGSMSKDGRAGNGQAAPARASPGSRRAEHDNLAHGLQMRINRSVVARAKLALATIVGGSPLQDRTANIKRSAESGRTEATEHEAPAAASGGNPGGPGMGEILGLDGSDDPVEDPSGKDASGGFRRSLRAAFMSVFATDLKEKCGVAVEEIALQDLRFLDKELAIAMARGAVARTELTQADIDRQVIVTKAESEQQANVTRAQGEAKAMGILARAEAERIRMLDDAMASASGSTQ